MRFKTLSYVIFATFVMLITLSASGNGAQGEKMEGDQGSTADDILRIYAKGEVSDVPLASPDYKRLKDALVSYTVSANDTYRFAPTKERFANLKKNGYAIELTYSSPKELKIDFLRDPVTVSRIIIPLSSDNFPEGSLFVYTVEMNVPHVLANTKMTKDKLRKLAK